jgi:murein DD-endopeptidase MepM/ murein hydrolase activator NlpD
VLRKDETLEEVASYRLTLLNIYILLSSIVIFAMGLMLAGIFFTPLKRLVPGYGEPSQHPDYIRLTKKMETLESELDSYRLYYEHFSRLINLSDSIRTPSLEHKPRVTVQPIVPKLAGTSSDSEPLKKETERIVASPAPITSGLHAASYRYLMPPISGVLSSGFDADENHLGVDILAPLNTPVKAIWDGHVIMADWTLETGYTIGVQHSNDMVSFYKHNASLLKRNGAFVRAGEAIAIIGNTGKLTTGPHLHFELWLEGKPVDPTHYIDF